MAASKYTSVCAVAKADDFALAAFARLSLDPHDSRRPAPGNRRRQTVMPIVSATVPTRRRRHDVVELCGEGGVHATEQLRSLEPLRHEVHEVEMDSGTCCTLADNLGS